MRFAAVPATAGGFASFRLYPDKKYLNQVQFRIQAGVRDGYADRTTQDTWVRANVQFRLTEFNQIFVSYEGAMERFAGVDFKKQNVSVESQITFISWMPFSFFFETGDSINYDPDDAFIGFDNNYLRDELGHLLQDNYNAFIKFSYWWRL
jgi:hypothetical protein